MVSLGSTPSRPPPKHPADTGFTLRRDPPGAHGYELFVQPSLAPVPPADRTPLAPGHGGQHLVDPLDLGAFPPFLRHRKAGRHGTHKPSIALFQAGQEM